MVWCNAVFLLQNHKPHCTMRCGALLLAVWLYHFAGSFYGLCGLVNTTNHEFACFSSRSIYTPNHFGAVVEGLADKSCETNQQSI